LSSQRNDVQFVCLLFHPGDLLANLVQAIDNGIAGERGSSDREECHKSAKLEEHGDLRMIVKVTDKLQLGCVLLTWVLSGTYNIHW
jgi:hypothetical protein